MAALSTRVTHCRACKRRRFNRILDLGKTPPANAFLKNLQPKTIKQEQWFPLRLTLCRECSLVQLEDIVNPSLLFRNYVYVSSTSKVFVNHFEQLAKDLKRRFRLNPTSLVIDIGSNDGILLKPLKKLGVGVLGIEPATKIARLATKAGIKTIPEFFTPRLARTLRKQADVVTATNVFAHVHDLDELMEAVNVALKPEGVFMIEAPYLVDFLTKNLFDTVYHEHLSYFAVRPLRVLFHRLGFEIFDVQKVESHGGSLRVFVKRQGSTRPVLPSVSRFEANEKKLKFDTLLPYRSFAERVEKNKKALNTLLQSLKRSGKRLAGYGAPAKGNTLLNYFGITSRLLDFIVDDSRWKQGLYTPGTHIPVVDSSKLYENSPDYLLILAWNFAIPIMKSHQAYRDQGGKCIIPVPTPKVV